MGGGMLRTAAKVASIGGVVHGGFRGAPAVPPTGQSVLKASIPAAAATFSAAQNLRSASDVAAIEKQPSCDAIDGFVDWQLVGGGEEELVKSAGEPIPRVVFGAAPSFKEAQEATAELKDALDKVYLSSPKSAGAEDLSAAAADKVSGLSMLNPEAEAESEVESPLITRTSVPKPALQAFEMLSKNSEAQTVVASIASDPSVWNAMMQNSAVKQFMESHKSGNLRLDEYAADAEFSDPVSSVKFEEIADSSQSESLESVIRGFVNKVKRKVSNLVGILSTYIQNIFEPPEYAEDNGIGKNVVASSLMGLAVMVAMVVLLKRV